MVGSYHQRVESFEVLFNKTKYDALPAELKAILRHSAEAASADMSWKQQDRYPKDMAEMQARQGVRAIRTPDSVLQAQLNAWDKLLAGLTQDAYMKKVIDSQRAWAKRVYEFYRDYDSPVDMAYKHFNKA
jgi:TRAP-type mannitol/chloroaromatic compound transport system substrate-binding protein